MWIAARDATIRGLIRVSGAPSAASNVCALGGQGTLVSIADLIEEVICVLKELPSDWQSALARNLEYISYDEREDVAEIEFA
jgi:hypothetical protein